LPTLFNTPDIPPWVQTLPDHVALQKALHLLDTVPLGIGWNYADLADLLPLKPLIAAAVLIGLIPRRQGVQVLFTRRTETLRHHAGQVGFPGGRIESKDASLLAAALRESEEEIGLPSNQVHPLGYLDPFVVISGYKVIPVVAVIDPDFVAVPCPDEVAEVFEVPLDFLLNPANVRQLAFKRGGKMHYVPEYTWPDQRIWGASAAMLCNLRQRLEAAA